MKIFNRFLLALALLLLFITSGAGAFSLEAPQTVPESLTIRDIQLTNDGVDRVKNGTFTGAATDWTLASGWAYSVNTVVKNAAGTGALEQSVGVKAYEIWYVTATISNWTAGTTLTPSIGGTNGTAITGNSSYAEYIITTSTANLKFTPTTDVRATVDTVTATRVDALVFRNAAGAVTGWVRGDGATSFASVSEQNGSYTYRRGGSLADDGTFTLPVISNGGFGSIVVGANEESAKFTVKSDGTVELENSSANVVVNADTDTKVCIGTAVASPITIKNRLGSAKAVLVVVTYN